ncbi:putative type III effector protein [Xanthomonas translucens pv. poae]|uniref:Putative type III effector protein n=1 Tax=Xanthomonas graminis pv. poae TaxID=227946 RepID=A0A0K3ACB2_9XANT|nr:leucine-rich repeat domain-containing protein [Xanthomonas translucens]UKE63073.1 leucine-rich repeat domain-containing protein [Xanthomonas translucens pv. poae]CTP93125.1 putative type III effector protein [Xanthomonas translucens pv. poae]
MFNRIFRSRTTSDEQRNNANPGSQGTPARAPATPAPDAPNPAGTAMELTGLSQHPPSRQQHSSHSGASSSTAPRSARTLRRTTQIDRDTVPRFASAIETSEPAANLSSPRLNTIGRERLNLGAVGSPQLMQGGNLPLEQQLNEWENQCLQNTGSWMQEWQASIQKFSEVETNPDAAVLSTKKMLREAARPSSKLLRINFTALPHLPSDLSPFTHLKKIEIGCTGLQSLPDSIGDMQNLRELTLISNPVKHLPHSLCHLSGLQSLEILDCKQFETLPPLMVNIGPAGLQGLTGLKNLTVRGSRLASIPDSVTYMSNLERLELKDTSVQELPPDITQLRKLQQLNLEKTRIRDLQQEVCELPNLKKLYLANCAELRTLPLGLGQLRNLEELNLRGCNNLLTLPESISELPVNCTIKVPRHLEAQLATLRSAVGRPAGATAQNAASSSTSAAGPSLPQGIDQQAMKQIDARAYAALNMIEDEGKNPFTQENPVIDQIYDTTGKRMTLGEIPAVKQMIKESKNDVTRNILLVKRVLVMRKAREDYDKESDIVNVENLSRAVNMWRSRERIVVVEPNFRRDFPELELHLPEQTQTDAHADPQQARD